MRQGHPGRDTQIGGKGIELHTVPREPSGVIECILANNFSGAVIVAMTPSIVYSYLPCTTDKPLLRFGLPHKTVTNLVSVGLLAAGILLGITGFAMAQQSGLPIFHTNLTLVGAGIPLLVLLVVGKSSHVDEEDLIDSRNTALHTSRNNALNNRAVASLDEGAASRKAGDNALRDKNLSRLAPIIEKLVEFKQQNKLTGAIPANTDGAPCPSVEAWLASHGLTPIEKYAHALEALGAASVNDVVHHVTMQDLEGVLKAVPRNKLWRVIEAARKENDAAPTDMPRPKRGPKTE